MTTMNRTAPAICPVMFLFVVTSAHASPEKMTTVPIVISPGATSVEQIAAQELAGTLAKVYPRAKFEVVESERCDRPAVYLRTPASSPRLCTGLGDRTPRKPEGYVVTTAEIDGHDCGLIIGTDPAGVMNGVHGLLRHLGVGYFLNGDTLPKPTTEPFSFAEWDLSDRPLVPTRMVFNWHNFLSGCSTWDVEHWRQWIVQSQKMGYNAVMVHAYGNNPMAGFKFEGIQKPVGYLSSTRVGRDWSTNHVNDVRRLFGGSVFQTPVFGCVAAVEGTDLERTGAAQSLMSKAFATAEQRGVDVYFAVDIDTTSANPQKLIRALPEHARFETDVPAMAWMGQEAGKTWLVNPDTKEGYEFYKAQVKELLRVYPQIDCLVAWHRRGNTPWMAFSRESMPHAWQKEFTDEVSRTPEAEQLWYSHHLFAQAKIVGAFRRALDELNRPNVRLAFGSWRVDFLPAADRFLPQDVALIPLDWMVLKDQSIFDTAERRTSVAEIAGGRPVIPIAWAHHDDGNYVGRPYTPYSDFYDRLTEMKCTEAGFGIIHWTTKPLDLYFQSLVNQVWQSGKNERLEATCQQMARQLVGPSQAESFAAYLKAWVTAMPKIGRETSDFFIDHELKDLPGVEAAHRSRLKMLDQIDRSQLSATGSEWLDYFTGLEHYVLDVYRTENAFNRAKKQYHAGQIDAARTTMAACRPEEVIKRFADFSQKGGLSRGEEGLVVTMNTRWLPHYVRFRQMLGVDSVRYNFAPTSHDPLAQSRGIFTFHFDSRGDVWQCLGSEETGANVFRCSEVSCRDNPAEIDLIRNEICQTGIETDEPITLAIAPILAKGSRGKLKPERLPAGSYELTLLCIDPTESNVGENVFDFRVTTPERTAAQTYHVGPTQSRFLRLRCRGNNRNNWNSVHELRCDARDRSRPITASAHTAGYASANAIDGDPSTRWAVEGPEHWLQISLDPKRSFERLEIAWYDGASRVYDFDILVSEDGEDWREVPHKSEAAPPSVLASDRIDVREAVGGPNRVQVLSYRIELNNAAMLELALTPVRGKARLCGVILTPIAGPDETPDRSGEGDRR